STTLGFRWCCLFLVQAPAPTRSYPLSLHDALPIFLRLGRQQANDVGVGRRRNRDRVPARKRRERLEEWAGRVLVQEVGEHEHPRSEEHTSELQSLAYLVCRLLLEKKRTLEPDAWTA